MDKPTEAIPAAVVPLQKPFTTVAIFEHGNKLHFSLDTVALWFELDGTTRGLPALVDVAITTSGTTAHLWWDDTGSTIGYYSATAFGEVLPGSSFVGVGIGSIDTPGSTGAKVPSTRAETVSAGPNGTHASTTLKPSWITPSAGASLSPSPSPASLALSASLTNTCSSACASASANIDKHDSCRGNPSVAAKAGIGIGAAVAVIGLLIATLLLLRRRRRAKAVNDTTGVNNPDTPWEKAELPAHTIPENMHPSFSETTGAEIKELPTDSNPQELEAEVPPERLTGHVATAGKMTI